MAGITDLPEGERMFDEIMAISRMRAGAATGLLEAVSAGGGRTERVLAAAGLGLDDLADPDRMRQVVDNLLRAFDETFKRRPVAVLPQSRK